MIVRSAARAPGPRARGSSTTSIFSWWTCACPTVRRGAGQGVRKLDGRTLPILVFSGTVASADEVRELAALGVGGYINEYSAAQHILPSIAPHLFPDNFNRREQPARRHGHPDCLPRRQDHRRGADAEHQPRRHGHSHHQAARARHRGEAAVRLPGSKKDIEVEARVCWSDAKAGMGLRFTRVEAADQPRSTTSSTRTSSTRRAAPRPAPAGRRASTSNSARRRRRVAA